MLFQEAILNRIFIFMLFQVWPIIFNAYFSYKLLKRSRNRSITILSIALANFPIVMIIAFFSIVCIGSPFSKILYSISLYIFFFNQGLFIIVSWLMTRMIYKTQSKSIIIIIIIYLILSTYVFWVGYPLEGLIYGESTGWRPVYSWLFFWVSVIYVTFFLIGPQIFFAIKLNREFKGSPTLNRVNQFSIGIFLNYFEIYFLLLYNTLVDVPIYQLVHSFVGLPLNLAAAYLVYQGLGKALQ